MNPSKRRRPRSAGLTVVELAVVSAVLGLLATISFPYFRCMLAKHHMASKLADLQTARDLIELHKIDLGYFPGSLQEAFKGAQVPTHLSYCLDDKDDNKGHGNEFCTFFDEDNPSGNAPKKSLGGAGYLLMTERDLCPCNDVDFVWVMCCGMEPYVVAPGEMEPPGHPGNPGGGGNGGGGG